MHSSHHARGDGVAGRRPSPPGRGPRALVARLAGALCVWLVVAGIAGCTGHIDKPGPVLLVGDSIFFLASDDLTYALRAHGWKPVISAYPGSGIKGGGFTNLDWPATMRDLVAFVHPKAVVVELGTNGCQGCSSLGGAIDDVMRSLRGVPTVLWLTTNTEGPFAARGKRVNAALSDATRRWGNLELLRYDRWMAGRTDLVPADNVHPTAAGTKALAGHVTDALDERSTPWNKAGNQALGLLAAAVIAAFVLLPRKKPAPARRR